jgi:Xaa-Pro aminopeptidase
MVTDEPGIYLIGYGGIRVEDSDSRYQPELENSLKPLTQVPLELQRKIF